MHGLRLEYRRAGRSIASALAEELSTQASPSKVAIVAARPTVLLSATRKEWLKRIRRLQRECASTVNKAKAEGLARQIAWMESLSFSAKPPEDLLESNVTFATAESFVHTPPECSLVYVTYTFEKEKLHMLTSWMPKSGKVIIYE